MRAKVVDTTSAVVWLTAAVAFACIGLATLGSYLAGLGPAARGTWGTSDILLLATTGSRVRSETLAASLHAIPASQTVFVIGPVSELEHWSGLWYLVGYMSWPHPVSSLLCSAPGQINDYPPPPAPEAPAGSTVVLLREHPTWLVQPTVFSSTLSMVSIDEPKPWNSFCQ